MQNKTLKKLLSLTLCIVLAAALALFAAGCGNSAASEAAASTENVSVVEESAASAAEEETPAEEASTEDAAAADVTVLGEGATVFTFTVIDGDGNETDFEIHTDEATVGDALLAEGLIAGEDSEYGLYVKTVLDITADYDVDGTYWAFYINDEYASTGVDATDVEAGAVYSFRVE